MRGADGGRVYRHNALVNRWRIVRQEPALWPGRPGSHRYGWSPVCRWRGVAVGPNLDELDDPSGADRAERGHVKGLGAITYPYTRPGPIDVTPQRVDVPASRREVVV